MAGDISRSSFQRLKGNTGVRMQQGRVQVDADWNEQIDIQAYRERTLTTDLIGSAAPAADPGFGISASGGTLTISPGRIYVDGILCENEQACTVFPRAASTATASAPSTAPGSGSLTLTTLNPGLNQLGFAERLDLAQQLKRNLLAENAISITARRAFSMSSLTHVTGETSVTEAAPDVTSTASASPSASPAQLTMQPFPPAAPNGLKSSTPYVLYLDVWERDITALEDPSIREIALGGPDTTTRTRVIWQVKLAPNASNACPSDLSKFVKMSTGKLSAQAAATQTSSNPCVIPATAGYRSLENQLYRIEVHTAGSAGTATLKWSRDNASIVVGWQGGNTDLAVTSLGRDSVLGFAPGQWVELTDDLHEYAGRPGTLVQLSNAQLVGQVPTLSLDTTTATGSTNFADFAGTPKVRRWDQTTTATTTLNAGTVPLAEGTWIDLENGVQVYFEPGGYYNTGDYWLIPARTATTSSQPTVLWPVDGANDPLPQSPNGIRHHYTPLAVATMDTQQNWSISSDCRSVFAPIVTAPSVRVLSVQTAEASPIDILPFSQIAPEHLIAGLRIRCDQALLPSALNVATLSISIDLPAADGKFAESTVAGQQIAAAVAIKVMGNYGLSADGRTVTWIPFPSARAYFLTELAALGAITLLQGRALMRLTMHTSAIRTGAGNGPGFADEPLFTLPAWVLPYTDPSRLAVPIFTRMGQIVGPDASGDYVATGFMTGPQFAAMQALPQLDVAGGKLYAEPMLFGTNANVYAYVPSATERKGNFASFSLPIPSPQNGQPFPGNQIPTTSWPGSATGALGVFAWRFRAYVPASAHPYSYSYGYAGNSAVGGELI